MIETQLPLLSDSPIARGSDPSTSHEAAEDITSSGVRASQQRTVLALVRAYPGRTSAEMAARSRDIDRWTAARRLPELRAEQLVRNGEPKQCGVTGKRALTWFLQENDDGTFSKG